MSSSLRVAGAMALGALVVAVAALAVRPGPTVGAPATDTPALHTITISATGSVTLVPDVARVGLGVTVTKPTVKAAREASSTAMNAIIASLKALGIDEKDIKTTSIDLGPQYNNGSPAKVVGYRMSQQVQVTVRDLDKAGDVIDDATAAGATDVAGLWFEVEDPDKAMNDARADAIAQARTSAQAMAAAAGVTLKGVVSMSEASISYPGPWYGAAGAVRRCGHDAGPARDAGRPGDRHGHLRDRLIASSTRAGVAGTRSIRAPVAWRMAPRMAGAVGMSAGSPTPFAPNGPAGSASSTSSTSISRDVADGRDQVVVEVVGPARLVLLHERESQALGDPAVDLPLDEHRVDRPADVMGRDDPANDARSELQVNVHDGDLGPEAVGLVRDALAVGVERSSCADRTNRPRRVRIRRHRRAGDARSGPETSISRRRSSAARRVALPDTNVCREAEVLPASSGPVRVAGDPLDPVKRDFQGVGRDLGVRSYRNPGRCPGRR